MAKGKQPTKGEYIEDTSGNKTAAMCAKIFNAIQLAEAGESALDDKSMIITQLDNNPVMATKKCRHLFNNLGSVFNKYLEIGAYMGGSAVAAGYKNKFINGWAVDSFSEFHGVEQSEVAKIARKNLELTPNIKLIEKDCFELNPADFKDIDLFFYDGDHTAAATEKGLLMFSECWADSVCVIIDDWNWQQVQLGGLAALGKLQENWIIRFKLHLEGAYNAQYEDGNEWGFWNGLLIVLLEKKNAQN